MAGILAKRENPSHQTALATHGIEPIDLVVVNLYPFAEVIARPQVSRQEAIEQIDIGGLDPGSGSGEEFSVGGSSGRSCGLCACPQ